MDLLLYFRGGSEILPSSSHNEVFALLGYYVAHVASCLPTFRYMLSAPYSGVKEYILELLDTWNWNRYAVPKHRYAITNVRCLTSQNNEDLYFVDHASLYSLFQMKPTRCTLLLGIFISTSLHVSGNYVSIIMRTLLYLCDTSIFHCVWVAVWSAEKYQCRIDTVSSPDDGHIVARNM